MPKTMTGRRSMPKNSLVAVLSATPVKAKSGTSWLGSPQVRLRRARMDMDQSLTLNPSRKTLQIYRSCWERGRAVPVIVTAAIAAGVLAVLDLPATQDGYLAAALLGTLVVLGAGAVAAGSLVAVKWLLVRLISGIKRFANVRISRRRLEGCASSIKGSYAVVAATEAMIVFRSSAPITASTVV